MMNDKFISEIKAFEGFRAIPYNDCGRLSIGYGHSIGVKPLDKMTEEEATKVLIDDLENVYKDMNKRFVWFHQLPYENQRLALTSLVFNIGIGRFNRTSFPKLIEKYIRCYATDNPSTFAQRSYVGEWFMKFNHSGGKVLKGLTKRRTFEYELWMKS